MDQLYNLQKTLLKIKQIKNSIKQSQGKWNY